MSRTRIVPHGPFHALIPAELPYPLLGSVFVEHRSPSGTWVPVKGQQGTCCAAGCYGEPLHHFSVIWQGKWRTSAFCEGHWKQVESALLRLVAALEVTTP